jgi:phosphoglycerate dehydrogenase-like enzyme
VDLPHLAARGIPVAGMPGSVLATAVAEHVLLLMLCLAKNLAEGQRNVRSGIFHEPPSRELHGKTLGLVGLGATGRETARRARTCGMEVLAVDAAPVDPQLSLASSESESSRVRTRSTGCSARRTTSRCTSP